MHKQDIRNDVQSYRSRRLSNGTCYDYDIACLNSQILVAKVKNFLETVKKYQQYFFSKHRIDDKFATLGLYYPLLGEADLLEIVLNINMNVALPKVKDNTIEFVRYEIGSPLEVSTFKKIMQPKSNYKVIPNIVVTPGLAYSLDGHRVGFGAGFYDRYFAQIEKKNNIIKIGVCFHQFLREKIYTEQHDVKMDYIITEEIFIAL